MIDRADIPPKLMQRLIEAEIGRTRVPRVVLDRFALGGFVFVDAELLPDRMLRLEIMQKIQEGLDSMQLGVQCDDIGCNPHGPVETIRMGAFNSLNFNQETLAGIWLMGPVASPSRDKYTARFMPFFPTLDDSDHADLTADVCSYLLNTLPTATYPAGFTALNYASILGSGDAAHTRMVLLHTRLTSSPGLTASIGDTPIPQEDRVEVTLTKAP